MIAVPWTLILLAWYAIAYSGLINPSLVPTPHAVAARFWELLTEGRLLSDMWMSTQRVFLGVAFGIVVAVPVGFVLGWYREIRRYIDPADQLLPGAAADRADPAGHRLLRHRRVGQDRDPVLCVVLRRASS